MATSAKVESADRELSETVATHSRDALPSRRSRIVGAVTAISIGVAVMGYLREATLAARFGVSSTMDAYFGAIFVPNTIYLILVVGTVSPILIPILLQHGADNRRRVSESFSVIANFVLILFAAVVICGLGTARYWLAWLFPGFTPGTQTASLKLLYIILPAIPILALAGTLTATLNAFHKYSLAAFAPALSSIAVIVAALVARGEHAIYIVGISTTVGFLLQFLVLVPAVRALGISYRLTFNFRHPAILRLIKLGSPLLLYLAVANASLVIERNLASTISSGAVATLTYALRLFAVPSNFIVAPLMVVAYPYLAREARRENYGELRQEVTRVFRIVIFVFVPATVWLAINALPITRVLYERGNFAPADSSIVALVFSLYAIGILPNAITVLLLRCFYAAEDTITPLWVESIDLVYFVFCAPILAHRFGLPGLAIARAIAFVLVAALLTFVLWRVRRLMTFNRSLLNFVTRIVVASAAMAVVSALGLRVLQGSFDHANTLLRAGFVGTQLAIDAAVFFGAASLMRVREAKTLLSLTGDLSSQRAQQG